MRRPSEAPGNAARRGGGAGIPPVAGIWRGAGAGGAGVGAQRGRRRRAQPGSGRGRPSPCLRRWTAAVAEPARGSRSETPRSACGCPRSDAGLARSLGSPKLCPPPTPGRNLRLQRTVPAVRLAGAPQIVGKGVSVKFSPQIKFWRRWGSFAGQQNFRKIWHCLETGYWYCNRHCHLSLHFFLNYLLISLATEVICKV